MIKYFKGNKKILLLSICIFLLIHMMKIVNYYPNWDSMYAIVKYGFSGLSSGRWFSGISLLILSSAYDLQWVNGAISSIFFSLTISLLINLYTIKKRFYCFIAIVLFAVFPSMASTLTYFTSPANMFALFLSVLGVYLCIMQSDRKRGFAAILCFGFSLGIYQIYIFTAIIAFLYYVGNKLLDCEENIYDMKKTVFRFLISIIGGGGLYWLINSLLIKLYNYEITSYQGISEVGIMTLYEYALALKKMIKQICIFFLGVNSITIYGIINIFIIIIALCCIVFILLNRVYTYKRKIALCILFLSCLPISYSGYLLSPGIGYHSIMEVGNYFIYLFIILIIDKQSISVNIRKLASISLLLLCFYHFLNDNIAYHQLNIGYEKTKFTVMETLIQIDLQNMEDIDKIAVIGIVEPDSFQITTIPFIMGATSNYFIPNQFEFIQFAKYFYGREFNGCTEEETDKIKRSKEFEQMPIYPNNGYVKNINGVIVVKLSK